MKLSKRIRFPKIERKMETIILIILIAICTALVCSCEKLKICLIFQDHLLEDVFEGFQLDTSQETKPDDGK